MEVICGIILLGVAINIKKLLTNPCFILQRITIYILNVLTINELQ